jgi:hypothetical protein
MKTKHLKWLYEENDKEPFFVQKQAKRNSYRLTYPTGEYEIKRKYRIWDENISPKDQKVKIIAEKRRMPKKEMVSIVNNRQVMPFEIIFDLDEGNTFSQAKVLLNRLNDAKIKASVWYSGNKGHHVHVFIKQLKGINNGDRSLIRDVFYKIYGKYIKTDKQLRSDNVGIQIEYAHHRKTYKEKEMLLGEIAMNDKLPKEVMKEYLRVKVAATIKKVNRKDIPVNVGIEKKCIVYFKGANIPNGTRERVLFSVLSNLKHTMDFDQLVEVAKDYNYRHDNFLETREIFSKISNCCNSSKTTGCRFNKELLREVDKIELCKECIWNR